LRRARRGPEHGQVSFGITVEVDDLHRPASLALDELGFDLDEPTGWYTTHLTDDVLHNDEDPAPRLLEFVEGDITKLIDSRFLAPELDARAPGRA
jgi:hypothetical protein